MDSPPSTRMIRLCFGGLREQQVSMKEVIAHDREALEALESWRQMAGLEELQRVAKRMEEQLLEGEAI